MFNKIYNVVIAFRKVYKQSASLVLGSDRNILYGMCLIHYDTVKLAAEGSYNRSIL